MLKAKLILERFDKDYRLLERREQPSRSFIKHFIDLLYIAHAQIPYTAPYSMNDITGAARDIDSSGATTSGMRQSKATLKTGSPPGYSGVYCQPGYVDTAGSAGYHPELTVIEGSKIGIQVGTGVGAVTTTDNALGTRIAHGRAAGQFEYGGCEFIYIAFADPNGQLTVRRYFTNNSGGLITVQEAGIYAAGTKFHASISPGAWPFCIARDITGAVAVNNTELLRVTYVVQITV